MGAAALAADFQDPDFLQAGYQGLGFPRLEGEAIRQFGRRPGVGPGPGDEGRVILPAPQDPFSRQVVENPVDL
jgi:hypothetical protein